MSRGKPTPKCSQARSHLRAQSCVVKNGAPELQGAIGTQQVTSPCLGSECGLVTGRETSISAVGNQDRRAGP